MTDATRARLWRWAAIVPLIALGALAVASGTHDTTQAEGARQRMQATAQLVYGVAALLAALTLAMRSPLARRVFRIFAVAIVVAAGLAPVAWGGSSWWTGILAALVGALIAWLIWIPFRRGEAPPPA